VHGSGCCAADAETFGGEVARVANSDSGTLFSAEVGEEDMELEDDEILGTRESSCEVLVDMRDMREKYGYVCLYA